MKKLKKFALLGFLMCIMALLFIACGAETLSAPTGISIDEENRLTWNAVEGARTYSVYIENLDEEGEIKESASRKTTYSLSSLAEGDYIIKVKAIGGNQVEDSPWSKAYEFHKDYETGCLYTLINNVEYEITRSGSASGKVEIEDVYRGKPVTRIADNAFKGNKRIEEVIIGNNVEKIGEMAFSNCGALKSITIPDSVKTIGRAAFQSCRSLTKVNLPKELTELREYTFAYCRALAEIDLRAASLTKIYEGALSDCSALTEVILPEDLTFLDKYAFSACTALKTVDLPDALEEIGEYAFYRCENLTEIKFSEENTLRVIGNYAFSECSSLDNLTLPVGLETIGYSAFYQAKNLSDTLVIPDTVSKVGGYAFRDTALYNKAIDDGENYIYADKWLIACNGIFEELTNLTMDVLRSDVVGLADNVFANYPNLKTVELPQSVRFIGQYTFFNCVSLWKVQTYKVESIGDGAFQQCSALQRVLFGEGLLTIGAYAFYDCALLDNSSLAGSSSMIPSTVTSIGTYAFKNTALWNKAQYDEVIYAGNWVVGVKGQVMQTLFGAKTFYNLSVAELKAGTAGIADYAFYGVDSLTNVIGLGNVKKIGEGAFYNCTSLTKAILNDNIKEIKDYTFYNCQSLLEVNMPVLLETIGRSSFYRCSDLYAVTLVGSEVKTIKDFAFYQCANLSSINFGRKVETIGQKAFFQCGALKEVALPNTVQTLGDKAFAYCESMTTLTLSENMQEVGKYAFQNCSALTAVAIPDSVKVIEDYAFYKCVGLTEVTFGSSIEEIGEYAFMNASLVKSLALPKSVKHVHKYAFKGWNGLTSLVLQEEIERIDDHAFYGCKQATVYVEASDAESVLWSSRWNSSYRPIVWGCVLSEDGTYVTSVTIKDNTLFNKRNAEYTAPECAGKVFLGWATQEGGDVVYTAAEIVNAPKGTTLYAIWGDPSEVPELPEVPEPPESSEVPESSETPETSAPEQA